MFAFRYNTAPKYCSLTCLVFILLKLFIPVTCIISVKVKVCFYSIELPLLSIAMSKNMNASVVSMLSRGLSETKQQKDGWELREGRKHYIRL